MICHITMNIAGVRTQSVVHAASSIAALLLVLESVPESAPVKAIVRVVKPMPEHETVQ